MIISTPEITLKNDRVIVTAHVSYDHHPLNKPETAWYSFPQNFLPFISGRADPFAASLLPLAQVLHEDLIIKGPVSPRLVNGMREYQQVMNLWFPGSMHIVKIEGPIQEALPAAQAGQNCVTLFSGGVDSSYTLLSHLPDHQKIPAFQVKGALFIHGMDIPLQNQPSYTESLETFSRHLGPLQIEMIPCATNLHYFSSYLLPWGIAHGATIIGAGLVLDKLINNLLVPSSYSLDELIPWGSSPMIDHLLSTETMKITHHAPGTPRIEKVNTLSHWEPAQNFLRVCTDEEKRSAVQNCGRCEKCVRTMTMLEICGALPTFKTFKQPFGKWDIMKWTPHYEVGEVWTPEAISFAMANHHNEYILPLRIAHLKGKIRKILRDFIPRPVFNWLKKKIYAYPQDPFNPDFIDQNGYAGD